MQNSVVGLSELPVTCNCGARRLASLFWRSDEVNFPETLQPPLHQPDSVRMSLGEGATAKTNHAGTAMVVFGIHVNDGIRGDRDGAKEAIVKRGICDEIRAKTWSTADTNCGSKPEGRHSNLSDMPCGTCSDPRDAAAT